MHFTIYLEEFPDELLESPVEHRNDVAKPD